MGKWGGRATPRVNCFDFTFKRPFQIANEGLSRQAKVGRRTPLASTHSHQREREGRPGNKIFALARMLIPTPTMLARETISPDNLALLPHINYLWEMHCRWKVRESGRASPSKTAACGWAREDAQLFLYIFGGENSNSCGITTLQCRRPFNSALILARVSAREGRREGGGCCPINGDGETAATIYAKGEATSINGLFSYR